MQGRSLSAASRMNFFRSIASFFCERRRVFFMSDVRTFFVRSIQDELFPQHRELFLRAMKSVLTSDARTFFVRSIQDELFPQHRELFLRATKSVLYERCKDVLCPQHQG